jgi:hypothetical protein
MSEEEKQALTGLCKIEIKRWKAASESNPNMRYMSKLMEIALATLTATPVKLPSKSDVKMGGDAKTRSLLTGMNMMRKNCADAIRAAGYEVQE